MALTNVCPQATLRPLATVRPQATLCMAAAAYRDVRWRDGINHGLHIGKHFAAAERDDMVKPL